MPRVPRALIALTALAAALRLPTLGSQSLWLDEVLTGNLARGSLGDLFHVVAQQEANPPLFYLVEWLWTRVAGTSEFALRLPSALCGIALVPVAYAIGKRLARRARPAVALAALVAVHPLLVYYSQEARGYAAVALACAVGFLCFLDARGRRGRSGGRSRRRSRSGATTSRSSRRDRGGDPAAARPPRCPRWRRSAWSAPPAAAAARAARRRPRRQRDAGRRARRAAPRGSGRAGSWASGARRSTASMARRRAARRRRGPSAMPAAARGADAGGRRRRRGGADAAHRARRRRLPQQPQHDRGAGHRAGRSPRSGYAAGPARRGARAARRARRSWPRRSAR